MRAVLDCNVVLSGLITPGGPPALILDALVRKEFECVLSAAILAEWRRALLYPKIRARVRLTAREQESFLTELALLAVWVEDRPSRETLISEDPDDAIYLAAAAEGSADFVVSGDGLLLKLKEYGGIPILSPREFIDELG